MLVDDAQNQSTTWVGRDGAPFDSSGGLKTTVSVKPTEAGWLFEGAPRRSIRSSTTPRRDRSRDFR
jgi:hypothetical protein